MANWTPDRISDLSDTLIASIATSDVLQWNGTRWVNVANVVFRTVGTINTGSLLVWNGTEVIGTVNTVTLNNADLTLYNNTLEGGTLRVQNNTRSSVLDATSLTIGNDVTLSRLTASVLQVGTGDLPDALTITDYFAVNRQSSTQERQVVKITTSMPVATDATRTGRVQFFVGDSAVAEREVLRLDATGAAAEMQLIGNVTAPINSRVASAATNSLSSRVTADANDRLQIQPGIVRFGDGTSAVDTAISRGAVGQVNFTANTAFGVSINAQSQATIILNRNGSGSQIAFQDNGTVPTVGRISNITANNSLAFQNSTGATTYYEFRSTALILNSTVAAGGIVFNTDTNLYRSTADTLRTDDSLIIGAALSHIGSTAGFFNTAAVAKPTVTGSRGGNAALASLLTALAGLGLITDSSSA